MILEEVTDPSSGLRHDYFHNKTVLITGASGLIGTNLLAYFYCLARSGRSVSVCSIINSKPASHIEALHAHGNMSLLELDLTQRRHYDQIPEADVIIHAAGYAQPMLFMANPAGTLAINVCSTLALFEVLKSGGTFIFFSSAEIYCGNNRVSNREDECGTSTPYHPRAAYIEGKRGGEAVCAAFRSRGGRAISIRLGDIYGPGTRVGDKRALNSFIEQALTTGRITLRDQGLAQRNYCYVSDAVESILDIVTRGRQQVYNLGGNTFTNIRDIALLIGNIAGVPVSFPSADNQVAGSPSALGLDLARLEQEFGRRTFTTLETGLSRTIEWQRLLYSSIAQGD